MEWKVSEDFVYDSAHSREGRQSIYRRKTHKKVFLFSGIFYFCFLRKRSIYQRIPNKTMNFLKKPTVPNG